MEDQIIEVEVVSVDPDFDFDSPEFEACAEYIDPNEEVMSILAQVNESIQEENERIERDLVTPRKRIHKKSFSLPASPTFDFADDINLSISLDDINVDGNLDASLSDKAEDFNLLEWIHADSEKRVSVKKTKQSRGKDLSLVRAEMEKEKKKVKVGKKGKKSTKKTLPRRRKPTSDSEDDYVAPTTKPRGQKDPTWNPSGTPAPKSTPAKVTVEKPKQPRGKNDLSSMKMKFLAANPIPLGFKKRKDPIQKHRQMADHDYCSSGGGATKVVPKKKCQRTALEVPKEKEKHQEVVDKSWRIENGDIMTYVGKEVVVETEKIPKIAENTTGESLLKPLSERIPDVGPKSLASALKFIRKEDVVECRPKAAPYRDPITVAKEKALRIRERKRAKALRMLDEEVKAKSASIMPILPLAEITGMRLPEDATNAPQTDAQGPKDTHLSSEYEEIVIVSMGCNTDVSIPPKSNTNLLHKSLSNIAEAISKTASISSNSLLFSIQDMMLKKRNSGNASGIVSPRCAVSPPNGASPDKPEGANGATEHGEDKVIMHLRKDRVRPIMVTMAIQTESYGDFPPIKLRNNSRKRSSSTESSSSSSSSSTSSSSSSTSSERSYKVTNRRNYRSRNQRRSYRSRSRSSRSPTPRARSRNTRSRSFDRRSHSLERRSRSRDRHHHQRLRNPRTKSPEERRIVYVGKLEEDLTKDDLKRKFLAYGPITKVTLHYKEITRMRYGFVTFERARDAYNAIDSGSKNPNLSHYDISFGGRRAFCRASYSDLDNLAPGFYGSRDFYMPQMDLDVPVIPPVRTSYESFDSLLQSFKRKVNP